MTIAAHFKPQGMTAETFDLVHKELSDAGAGIPSGRLLHIAFGPSEAIEVIDVWETMDDFTAFGAKLMPILASHGIDPGQPNVQPVDRLIKG
ncbi:MAG: hypothetical protein QOE64_1270 [Frankiales bacterium]|nr:hypothetical protein [Frankiales bacterium]